MTLIYRSPRVSLDTARFSSELRWKAWKAYNKGFANILPAAHFAEEVYAVSDAYFAGPVIVGHSRHSPTVFSRFSKQVCAHDPKLVILIAPQFGSLSGIVSGRSIELTPTEYGLFDAQQEFRLTTDEVGYFFLVLPHSEIGFDPKRHPLKLNVAAKKVTRSILRSNLTGALEQLPASSAGEAAVIGEGLAGLARGLLSRRLTDASSRENFSRSLEVSVRQYIERNLRNPDLSSSLICREIGISRPVLYRMLEMDGGVRKSIQRRRLESAVLELGRTEPVRGAIARIARHWLFSDQAHFSRLVKDTYGRSPSSILGDELSTVEETDDLRPRSPDTEVRVRPLIDLYRAGATNVLSSSSEYRGRLN